MYEAIRTALFVRNSCLHYWINNKNVGRYDLNKYCALQARDFPFADELNSMARIASAERAGSDISRFSDNCKKGNPGKKGYPQFQKDCRSVEYKTTGWKLADGVYIQFCVEVDRKENTEPCGTTTGLDVGLKEYYTDSNGITVENPKFLRKGKKVLQRSGHRLSRRVKGSKNRGSREANSRVTPSQNK